MKEIFIESPEKLVNSKAIVVYNLTHLIIARIHRSEGLIIFA
jgi:hypothetical protein